MKTITWLIVCVVCCITSYFYLLNFEVLTRPAHPLPMLELIVRILGVLAPPAIITYVALSGYCKDQKSNG